MKHLLLIDLGTGSTRVSLATCGGKLIETRSFFNRYFRDEAYPDAQYFLPEEWGNEILRCCEELHAARPDIRVDAVSSAGARQTIVLLDREGRAFYALPNIDNRGREFMGELAGQDWIYERSGKWVTEDFCAAKLLGLRRKRPELYDRIGRVLSLSGYIAWMFTGETVFEPSQACETQLYDLETGDWSDALCEVYGVDRALLPPLISAGETVGPVLPALREKFGMSANAVFIAGGADTQTALLQTGIGYGDIAVVSGTTTPVAALTERKFHDPQQRVWVDANLGAEGFLIEMNPGVTGLNYQRAKDLLLPEVPYAELERIYERKQEFRCTASFSSLLFYERRSLRKGGFFLPSPLSDQVERSDLLWAVMADTACATYEQLRRLRSFCGHERDYVLACGGGFRSPALCRMLADLSGLELRLLPGYEQATLSGLAAICAGALGEPSPCGGESEPIRYRPQSDSLILRYHPAWLRDRERL